jgi:hypothetical protein
VGYDGSGRDSSREFVSFLFETMLLTQGLCSLGKKIKRICALAENSPYLYRKNTEPLI